MITADEIQGDPDKLNDDEKESIDVVLRDYGNRSPYDLREQTHFEEPWKQARGNLPEDANSETIITLDSMGEYYGSL